MLKELETRLQQPPDCLPSCAQIARLRLDLTDRHLRARIEHLSPKGVPVVLRVPLLGGESVLSDGIRVKQGMVLVNMAPEQSQMHGESSLDGTPQIRLKATDNPAWSELWRADIAPIWHAELGGIPVVHHQDPGKRWLPEWRPWPGEELKLNITRPQGVEGQTITLDNARLQQSAGRRAADITLELVIRSSRGDQHTLALPEQARLQSVTIDGVAQLIRQDGRLVTLPIKPGRQVVRLNWIVSEGIPAWLETPGVNLGASSVNSSITVKLSRDRWVLLTSGPRLGPAVLFWGVLLIIILVAIGLARVRLTPLKYWHWLLLGIGLSQAPVWAAIFVVGWLFALSALFNAIQHGLLGVPEMQIAGNHFKPQRASADQPSK
jgi:hypothetical protein